uniref:FYVE-type domain-containing protein n=1 Tax=Timema tahoe TaxID=61484 RepID=A0A7R9IIU0_9NEOP|nr:unnamed protein product [Timema tahoe]
MERFFQQNDAQKAATEEVNKGTSILFYSIDKFCFGAQAFPNQMFVILQVSSPVKPTTGSEVSQHRDQSPQRLSVSTKVNTRSLSANSLSSLNGSPDKTVKQDTDSYNRNEHPEPAEGCDMCSNYEAQLVRAQQCSRDMERQLGVSERTCERLREDLGKESTFRKEMEERWSQKKEEHKAQVAKGSQVWLQVAELKKQMLLAENEMRDLRNAFQLLHGEVLERLNSLSNQREQVQQQLVRLQEENDQLVGKHSVAAETLQNERIDFPDTVEELQELLLKCRDDLIRSKLASERLEEDVRTLQCENQLLRAQMDAEQAGRVSMEDNLSSELDNLKTELHQVKRECKVHQGSVENLQLTVTAHQETISDLKSRLDTALRAKVRVLAVLEGMLVMLEGVLVMPEGVLVVLEGMLVVLQKHLEDTVAELRSRVASLQQELDNSEAVQKDFVRLSQSLQVQLERIRDTDMEVRWQHDEDIDECQGCHTSFSVARRKQHCRHCGRIFCVSCLSHTVLSGPHQRPSRVCDVCHTLLVRDTAPYFSTEPPHTPD